MIDWLGLFTNSLWILGLAVCLATLSLASYRTRTQSIRLGEAFGMPGSQGALAVGLLLFCLGILATSQTWWQVLLSGLAVLLVAGRFLHYWRQKHGQGS